MQRRACRHPDRPKDVPPGSSQTSLILLSLILVPLAFAPHSAEPFLFYKTWLLSLCAAAIAVLGLASNWLRWSLWRDWPEGWILLALVFWAAFSACWATNSYFTGRDWPLLAAPAACCIAARAVLVTCGRRRAVCIAGALAGTVVACVALAETGGVSFGFREPGRILALFGYQNMVAQFLVCALSFTAGLSISVRTPRVRFLLFVCLGAQSVVLFLTMCRGAWMGTLAAWAVVGVTYVRGTKGTRPTSRRTTVRVAMAFGLLIAVTTAALALWGHSMPTLGSALQVRFWGLWARGSSGRLSIWRSTAALIADRPLTGFGFGNFPVEYPRMCADNTEFVRYAHNDVLQYAAELGVPGALLLIVLFAMAIRRGCRLLAASGSDHERGINAGFLAAVIGTAIHSLFSYNLYQAAPALYAYVAIGALAASTPGKRTHGAGWRPRAVGCLLAMCLALVSAFGLRLSWQVKRCHDGVLATMAAGDRSSALRHARRGQVLVPADPRFHYYEGLIAYQVRKWSTAYKALERARARSPNIWQVYYYLSRVALAQGRTQDAQNAAARAMALRKTDPELTALRRRLQGGTDARQPAPQSQPPT